MANELENKVVLITGGTTGIGFASAKRFAQAGAKVIVTGRNPETVAHAATELAGVAEVVRSDAADPGAIKTLIDNIKRRYGRLDVLFLNAGIAQFAPLGSATIEQFDRLWNVNVRGVWLTINESVSLLAPGASILVTTSVVDKKGMPGTSAYASTKAAVREIVRVAAAELAGKGIRVNALSPGPISTPIYDKLGMPQEGLDAFAANVAAQVPLGRFGTADEVASVALFLSSAGASYITGTELDVDGGLAQV